MKTNGERKSMNVGIRGGSIGAMALGFVLCVTSVGAAVGVVPCCLARTGTGVGVCSMVPTTDACASRGGRTATSCRACFIIQVPEPMIQQPGAEDENGGTLSDGTDEAADSDLADVASDAVQQGSPWTLLVATMFLVGL